MLMKVLPTIGKSAEALQFFLSMTYAVNEKRKSELDLSWEEFYKRNSNFWVCFKFWGPLSLPLKMWRFIVQHMSADRSVCRSNVISSTMFDSFAW